LLRRCLRLVGVRDVEEHDEGLAQLAYATRPEVARPFRLDRLVHGQDIAIPLDLTLEMPTEPSAEAATAVWSCGTRKARVFRALPVRGYRLTATDIAWTVGEGPEISGPISAFMLLLTGRPVALPRLAGDGASVLRANSWPAPDARELRQRRAPGRTSLPRSACEG
jgi:hypothetical protein